MNLSWPKQELTVALIVLAFWATGATASGNPLHAGEPDHLFLLSLEELMEVSIDLDGSHWMHDRDFLEAPGVAAAIAENLRYENDEGVPTHDIRARLISVARDYGDHGHDLDEK
jgi:hypothetical protein